MVVNGHTAASYRILARTVSVGGTAPGGEDAPDPPATETGEVPANDGGPVAGGPIVTGVPGSDPAGGGGGVLGWAALGLLGTAALARRARAGGRR